MGQSKDLSPLSTRVALVALTVVCGLGFARVYLANRSLWLDEAGFAMAVLRDPSVLAPLPNAQIAPVGFIAIVKWIVHSGFTSEYGLRLLPFVASTLVVPLTFLAARHQASRTSALFAAALVGLAPALLYFCAEFKPYAVDVFACALLVAVGGAAWVETRPRLAMLALTAAGCLVNWLSFPSVLVLAGLWVAVGVRLRAVVPPLLLAVALAVTIVNALVAFRLAGSIAPRVDHLQTYWSAGFLPFPPTSPYDATIWLERVLSLFAEPFTAELDPWRAGLRHTLLIVALWGAGVVSLTRQAAWRGLLVGLPLVATVGAAALHRYPATGRLVLFLAPVIAVGAAGGLDGLRARAGARVGTAVAGLVLLLPAVGFLHGVRTPMERQEVRTVLASLSEKVRPGDALYLHYGAVPAYEYYRATGRVRVPDGVGIVKGGFHRDAPRQTVDEVCSMPDRGQVWLVLSHVVNSEDAVILNMLGVDAQVRSAIRATGAVAYPVDRSSAQANWACRETATASAR